jgi:hypothetical protein
VVLPELIGFLAAFIPALSPAPLFMGAARRLPRALCVFSLARRFVFTHELSSSRRRKTYGDYITRNQEGQNPIRPMDRRVPFAGGTFSVHRPI